MQLKSIKDHKDWQGQRVLLRLDLNVPIKGGKISKEGQERLVRSLPTIDYLASRGAKVIIVAHLGRPEGKFVKKYSLRPVARALSLLLQEKITFWDKDFWQYYKASHELEPGTIVMLENIRFLPQEQKNSQPLAQRLSKLADIYVNDAFANIHRSDTSMLAITYLLPSFAGLLLQEEVKYLSRAIEDPSGLVVIFGGAKVSTKIKLIIKFSKLADQILVGGALANTMIAARGYPVGRSVVDKEFLDIAKKLLFRKVILPLDLVVGNSLESRRCHLTKVDQVAKNDVILDLGPQTIRKYLSILAKAKIVVWNGPLGYYENIKGRQASSTIMKALVKYRAQTIVGGGETVELVNILKLKNQLAFVSTGGGAMLSFLEGESLPALDRLKK